MRRLQTSKTVQYLEEVGAVLIRETNHLVWRLPNGRLFVMSKTPGDKNVEWGRMRDLRRLMAA